MTDETATQVEDTPKVAAPPVTPANVKEKPTAELSPRDIKYRAKFKETLSEFETHKAQTETTIKEINQKAEAALSQKTQVEGRWMEAELKAEAIAAGIIDSDLISLIDKSNLKVADDGSIAGLKEAVADFKTKKPGFFGDTKKTFSSSNATIPSPAPAQKVDAMTMSDADWKAARNRAKYGKF